MSGHGNQDADYLNNRHVCYAELTVCPTCANNFALCVGPARMRPAEESRTVPAPATPPDAGKPPGVTVTHRPHFVESTVDDVKEGG